MLTENWGTEIQFSKNLFSRMTISLWSRMILHKVPRTSIYKLFFIDVSNYNLQWDKVNPGQLILRLHYWTDETAVDEMHIVEILGIYSAPMNTVINQHVLQSPHYSHACGLLFFSLVLIWCVHAKTSWFNWGIPSRNRIPYGLTDFFFLRGFLLPPPNMVFSEAKHNEGNLVLTGYFRKTFL